MAESQATETLLSLRQVSVQAAGHNILANIDLDINRSRIVTLIGPNGAGKTTLVRVVLGLQAFTGEKRMRPGLRIGYMPQKLALNPQLPMTVKRFLQLSGAQDKAITQWLATLGITHLARKQMQVVSGGELQRVLLARALLRNPQLLVLDEPVQGVDVNGQAELYALIHQIKQQQGCAVLMVSHDLHIVMAQTDQVVCLNQHVCCHGHPEHISHDPAFVSMFGEESVKNMALYTHHHDHEHDLHGNVIPAK